MGSSEINPIKEMANASSENKSLVCVLLCFCDIVKVLVLVFKQVLFLEHNLNSFLGSPFVVIIFF